MAGGGLSINDVMPALTQYCGFNDVLAAMAALYQRNVARSQ